MQRAAASCHPMPNPRALGMRGRLCACSYSSHATQDSLTVTADTFQVCLTRAWGWSDLSKRAGSVGGLMAEWIGTKIRLA